MESKDIMKSKDMIDFTTSFNEKVGDTFNAYVYMIPGIYCPTTVADRFIETTPSLKLAMTLMEICIISATTSQRSVLDKYISKKGKSDNTFRKNISKLKARWFHEGLWNLGPLNLCGQCILETGFSPNNNLIKTYRTVIKADSLYSPDFDVLTSYFSQKARSIIIEKRERYTTDEVRSAGESIIVHFNKKVKENNEEVEKTKWQKKANDELSKLSKLNEE